jgi:hypothetical protein
MAHFVRLVQRHAAHFREQLIAGPLIVVACGKAKIWDKDRRAGATRAEEAYVGSPFLINKRYAIKFAARWIILSAKYGYIDPDFLIPGPYNVTFKDPRTKPISIEQLQQQVKSNGLFRFNRIVGLGGSTEYRNIIKATLGRSGTVQFPTRGLRIGQAMSRIKKAIARSTATGAAQ